MLTPRQSEHGGRSELRTRFGAKAVASIAAFSLVVSMCPGAAALAYARDQVAAGARGGGSQVLTLGDAQQGEGAGVSAQADDNAPVNAEAVTQYTHRVDTGIYRVTGDVEIKPDSSGNAIRVVEGASVFLYIDKGATLTVTGADAKETDNGHAAILLPEGSTLTVSGYGTLKAKGGRAGHGANGGNATASVIDARAKVGKGGDGGVGGGGAGAAIGTDGGAGGKGGKGGPGYDEDLTSSNVLGNDGCPGLEGYAAAPAGTLIATGGATVYAKGGEKWYGGEGGQRGQYESATTLFMRTAVGTSGGGGGGASGGPADGIGSGGTGGGGGGGGASANIDGEPTVFGELDDLWGHGGEGGKGAWGGGEGSPGDEGASNDGDDTDASKKYARSGGVGGLSANPRTVAFYTYKDSAFGAAEPKVECFSGHSNADSPWLGRSATPLGTLDDYKAHGGYVVINGGRDTYSGVGGFFVAFFKVMFENRELLSKLAANPKLVEMIKANPELVKKIKENPKFIDELIANGNAPSAQSASSAALSMSAVDDAVADRGVLLAQADGQDAIGESGTVEYDGMMVTYTIVYYNSAGERFSSEPVLPGQYVAIATFTSPQIEAGTHEPIDSWIVPFAIAKRQIPKPAPVALEFVCENWDTGAGAKQDAFPNLDETDYEFVPDAKAADGTPSLKSAGEAGNYMACFKLKDSAMCEWEGESEDTSEVWVPWSIGLAEFDPNDVTYWGTAYDNDATTVTYTGEPIWVRPWYTYTKSVDGKFPEWFTHWGSDDRPTSDRRSSVVVYTQGAGDYEGLVGYHTNADGSLEKVTAEQVYAWVNGVDVDGGRVAVESGDKVWYKTDEDGWKVPLAVGGEQPEGAEGYVVARDYAYVDKLGVKDPGTYQAYALFDEGAGFATTALATAEVKVTKAEASETPAKTTKSDTNSAAKTATAKTGDASPLAVAGAALAALMAAGALVLALRRRRC